MPLYFERNRRAERPQRALSVAYQSVITISHRRCRGDYDGRGDRSQRGRCDPESTVVSSDKLVESAVRIRLVGANPHPQFEALEAAAGPRQLPLRQRSVEISSQRSDLRAVKMKNVYPRIDLVYYGTPEALEYDLIAAPGADTSKLKFAVEGRRQDRHRWQRQSHRGNCRGHDHCREASRFSAGCARKRDPDRRRVCDGRGEHVQKGIARREVDFQPRELRSFQDIKIDPVIKPAASFAQYPILNLPWRHRDQHRADSISRELSRYLGRQHQRS